LRLERASSLSARANHTRAICRKIARFCSSSAVCAIFKHSAANRRYSSDRDKAPERYDAPFGALLYELLTRSQRAHISVHQQIRAFSMPHLRLMRQQEGQQADSDHLARRSTEKEFAPRHLTVCPHHQQVRVFLAGGG